MQRQRADHGRRLSREDHVEIQRRVSEGATFARAAAAVGCSTKSIQRFMARTGSMMPRSRARAPLRLSRAAREELSRGVQAGDSLRQIAARLGRAVSTISREVAWHGQREASRAWRAEQTAARRARRPKPEKLATPPRRCREVERRLLEHWSPQQIAARLVGDYPDDREMRVSHATIYRSLFVQARGALRKALATCLRTGRTQRRAHQRTEHAGTGRRRHMVLISDRPAAGPPYTCAVRSPASCPRARRSFAGRSPGTRGKRWPSRRSSPSTPRSPSSSATRTVPGRAAATRTAMACSASPSPRTPTSASTREPN